MKDHTFSAIRNVLPILLGVVLGFVVLGPILDRNRDESVKQEEPEKDPDALLTFEECAETLTDDFLAESLAASQKQQAEMYIRDMKEAMQERNINDLYGLVWNRDPYWQNVHWKLPEETREQVDLTFEDAEYYLHVVLDRLPALEVQDLPTPADHLEAVQEYKDRLLHCYVQQQLDESAQLAYRELAGSNLSKEERQQTLTALQEMRDARVVDLSVLPEGTRDED